MSTIFIETMSKAISDYRYLLRRYLSQVERVTKLTQLNLRNPELYTNSITLYKTAWAIVEDIQLNLKNHSSGYYTYSGISHFANYLRDYLQHYEIEHGKVVHRAQKASRAIIDAIQLLSLPKEKLNELVAKKFALYSDLIASYGSDEQHELYRGSLDRQYEHNPEFFGQILHYFDQQIRQAKEKKQADFNATLENDETSVSR